MKPNAMASFRILLAALALFIACTAIAYAQAPPDAGTLMREQQKTQPPELQRLPQAAPEKEPEQLEDSGMKFVIQGFRFSGNQGLATDAELKGLLADSVGKEMGLGGLRRLADRVTKHLNEKGWFLARAYIPKQEIKDGVVEVAVIGGKIEGGAEIRGKDLRVSQSLLQGIAAGSAPEGKAATQGELERAVLLMSDLPGVKATSTLQPGAGAGTAKLALDVTEGPLVSGLAWGDNYGSRYTGYYRGNALLQLNDPFHQGDQATFTSTDNTNYQYGQAGYSIPVGYSGLRAGVSYSEMRYEIDRDQIAVGLDGGSRVVTATLNYPILRSRAASLSAGLEYDWKNFWDSASNTLTDNKFINSGGARLTGNVLDSFMGGGYSTLNLGVTGGMLDLAAVPQNLSADQLTAGTNGEYCKITYAVNRLQKLYDALSLFVGVNGQAAFNNLDSSEKFLLGGPNGVRAYPTGEASGDSGGILTGEFRYDFPQVWKLGVPQLVGFYDLGWTQLHQYPWTNSGTAFGNRNSYTLSGGGVGVNLNKPGVYTIQMAWAAKVGSNPGRSAAGLDSDGKSDSNRFWVQAMLMF